MCTTTSISATKMNMSMSTSNTIQMILYKTHYSELKEEEILQEHMSNRASSSSIKKSAHEMSVTHLW